MLYRANLKIQNDRSSNKLEVFNASVEILVEIAYFVLSPSSRTLSPTSDVVKCLHELVIFKVLFTILNRLSEALYV